MSNIKEKFWAVVWTPIGFFTLVVIYPILDGVSWVMDKARKKGVKRAESKPNVQSTAAEIKELKEIYKEAQDAGIYVLEFGCQKGFMAAAGSIKKAEEFEKQLGQEIDLSKLTMAQAMHLGTLPGLGQTRAEACRNAVKAYKEHYKIK